MLTSPVGFILDRPLRPWHDYRSMTTDTFRLSGIVRAAAAALALALVPALAAAQTAPAKKQPRPAPAEAVSPAPAPAPRSSGSTTLPYAISVGIGPSFEGTTALKLRLEGSMVMKPLFPNSTFELALPLNLAFWSQTVGIFPPYSASYSYVRFEIVPTARVSTPVAKDLGIYGDAGLGFQYYSVSFSSNLPTGFPYSATASGAGGLFKLAGGGYYALDPHWRLFLEPIGLNFYFGGGSGFVYTIMLGGSYRFQG